MQVAQTFEQAFHDLFYGFKTVFLRQLLHTEITNCKREIICDDEKVLFAYYLLVLRLFNMLEISVFQFNYVLAELFLLDLIQGTQFSLFILSVVEKFLDCNVLSSIKWVKTSLLSVFCFVDRSKCAFASFFDDLIPTAEVQV